MTRGPLFALAALAGFALSLLTLRPFRPCAEGHDPERTPIGGFRCRRKGCRKVFADYGEARAMDDGYLDKRTQYGRGRGEGVTSEWFVQ